MSNELSDDARALIRDAVAAEVPAEAERRAALKRALLSRAAMLSVGAAAATGALESSHGAAGAAPAGGAAVPGAGAAVPGAGGALASAGTLGALFAKGAAVGIVVAGALHGVAHFSPHDRAAPVAITAHAPAAEPEPTLLRSAPPNPGAMSSAPSVGVAAAPTPVASTGSATQVAQSAAGSARVAAPPHLDASASESSPSLRAELDLMGAVQAALRDGRPARALELIDRYEVLFPHGQLENERLAAEAVAACQSGDGARGRRAAERFLGRDPTSAMAERVRIACPADGASRAR